METIKSLPASLSNDQNAMDEQSFEMQDNNALVTYSNASQLKITEKETKILQDSVEDNDIEIRPDGLIYLPQVFVRDRLNKAFGIGQWAIIQHKVSKDPARDKMYFDGSLYVRGSFVARAIGESEYHATNKMQSWASVYESSKSDCLVRCCKDIGIAKECWMPKFGRDWMKKYAVQVWREKTGKHGDGAVGSFQWRRKDSDPFYDEAGAKKSAAKEAVQEQPNLTAPAKKEVAANASVTEFDPTKERIAFGKYFDKEKGEGQLWVELNHSYLQYLSEGDNRKIAEKAIATMKYKASIEKQQPDDLDKSLGKKIPVAEQKPVKLSNAEPIEIFENALAEIKRRGTAKELEEWAATNRAGLDALSATDKKSLRKIYDEVKKGLSKS